MTIPQQPLLPAQQISLLDIYTKQVEMGADLRLLKDTLPDHENRIRSVEGQLPLNLEARLNSLENSKAKIIGAALGVSAVVSAGGTWIGLLITHH